MQSRRVKFVSAVLVLLGAVIWLGMSGYEEGKSYYKTCDEYLALETRHQERRIRLMGNVQAGSISREAGALTFALELNGSTVPVVYRGSDPVPDTFKDGVSALVEGTRGEDGRFVGQQIQAKCASKYEADPSQALNPRPADGAGAAAGTQTY